MDIRIPYFEDMQLGRAYNLAMETVKDWVLFVDHDLMLPLNPHYYSICRQAIHELGHKAGWITCKTNRIACGLQIAKGSPKSSNDMLEHMRFAKKLWQQHRGTYTICNNGNKRTGAPFSGFFMLTHKKAWEDVEGFKDGFLGVDNDYYNKLLAKGYNTYVLNGVYVYHLYGAKKKWDSF